MIVENTNLLGTHITNDSTWDLNTNHIVKKAYAIIQLLIKISRFGASREDMIHIYKLFVRSALEHSRWHKSLTLENVNDLERIQKSAFRLILGTEYSTFENAHNIFNIQYSQIENKFYLKKNSPSSVYKKTK